MSAPRAVGLALVIKYFFLPGTRRLRLGPVDILVVGLLVWTVLASAIAGASFDSVASTVGGGMDTAMIYFAARFCFQNTRDAHDALMPLALLVVYLGSLGLIESTTGFSPYSSFMEYHQWLWVEKEPEYRLGLLRAKVSTSHYIYYGLTMVLLVGLLYAMRNFAHSPPERLAVRLGLAAGAVGVASSLSTGPISGLMILALISVFYYRRRWIKPSLWGLGVLCLIVELASNRHFYELVDYIALSGTTAYYRTRLLEVALANLSEYAAFGLGGARPDHWGMAIDGRSHVDLVNHYVIVAVEGGVLSVLCLLAVQVGSVRSTTNLFKRGNSRLRPFAFSLGATVIALMLTTLSVGLFGPALMISYILYGMSSIAPTGNRHGNPLEVRPAFGGTVQTRGDSRE